MKLLIINPGSTSTKLALYDGAKKLLQENLEHDAAALQQYHGIGDQVPMRLAVIRDFLDRSGVHPEELAAVIGRGGLVFGLKTGGYLVNEDLCHALVDDDLSQPHASNLGGLLAREIAAPLGIPRGGGGGEPLGFAAGVILPLRERRQHIEGAQVAARAEQVGQQALKIACMDLFAQRVEHGGVVDIRQRITAVEPAVKRAAGKLHAVGLGDLAVDEGKALERRRERLAVEPGGEHIARDLRRKGLDLVKGVFGRVAHDERSARLINAVRAFGRHELCAGDQSAVGSKRSSPRNATSSRRCSSMNCASAFRSSSQPSRVAAEMT